MERGDIVTIYEDPITETKPEGKARLIQKTDLINPGLEYWAVMFLDSKDGPLYRFIKAES